MESVRGDGGLPNGGGSEQLLVGAFELPGRWFTRG